VNVTLPEPDPKVSELAPEAELSTALVKVIVFDVAVSVRVAAEPLKLPIRRAWVLIFL
jgi:hypothetical protein